MTIYHQNNNISNLNTKPNVSANIRYPELFSFCLKNNYFSWSTYSYENVNTLNYICREIEYAAVTLVMSRFESLLRSHDYKSVEEACATMQSRTQR